MAASAEIQNAAKVFEALIRRTAQNPPPSLAQLVFLIQHVSGDSNESMAIVRAHSKEEIESHVPDILAMAVSRHVVQLTEELLEKGVTSTLALDVAIQMGNRDVSMRLISAGVPLKPSHLNILRLLGHEELAQAISNIVN
jgi:hypothetical protein